jgi:hypothetical protein
VTPVDELLRRWAARKIGAAPEDVERVEFLHEPETIYSGYTWEPCWDGIEVYVEGSEIARRIEFAEGFGSLPDILREILEMEAIDALPGIPTVDAKPEVPDA